MSTNWYSNPDPSVSGQVPLPLDHLHSHFSLLFSSHLRASIVQSVTLTILHMCTTCIECYGMCMWMHITLLSRRCSCACASVNYHHLPYIHFSFALYVQIKEIFSRSKLIAISNYLCTTTLYFNLCKCMVLATSH